ncbi:hypothetical protein L7F22_044720 [Adiantum nelumboides]|nr:hypothetical protein [Adiantum nelumboides]
MHPSVEELAFIKMPTHACSFASEVHPLYEQVRAQSDRWIKAVAEMSTAAARRFLRDCLLPRLVCRFIPQALSIARWLSQTIQLIVPDMKTYMAILRQAYFTIPTFIIAEYASGVELDDAVVQNTKIVELCNKAVDYVSLCNNIFFCYKEITSSDYFNLPSAIHLVYERSRA